MKETNIEEPFVYWPNAELQITKNRHIQLDALLLAQNFACIFEIKNMRGSIKFLENPFQLSQSVEGEEKIYECPQSQIIRASNSMQNWFDSHNIPLPLHSKLVFSHGKTHIAQPPRLVDILFPKQISTYLEQLNKKSNVLTKRELEKVVEQLQTIVKPYNPFPLSKKLDFAGQVIEGIICICGNSINLRLNSVKHCPICGCSKRKFIEQAMYDWFTLFQSTITNEECRNFLEIENNADVSKLFSNMNLSATGNTWNRKYFYDYEKPLFKNIESRLFTLS